jgi:hypothetical protein
MGGRGRELLPCRAGNAPQPFPFPLSFQSEFWPHPGSATRGFWTWLLFWLEMLFGGFSRPGNVSACVAVEGA